MTLEIRDTQSAECIILENKTVSDIIYALNWIQKEKTRQANKHKKYYVPNGNPRGRPKKICPAEIKIDEIKID